MENMVVGCRGGNQNVEGCWGFPYLEIKRLPKTSLHVLIDMKCISTFLEIAFMQILCFPDPHLRKL